MVFLMCSESMQIYPTNKFLSEINPLKDYHKFYNNNTYFFLNYQVACITLDACMYSNIYQLWRCYFCRMHNEIIHHLQATAISACMPKEFSPWKTVRKCQTSFFFEEKKAIFLLTICFFFSQTGDTLGRLSHKGTKEQLKRVRALWQPMYTMGSDIIVSSTSGKRAAALTWNSSCCASLGCLKTNQHARQVWRNCSP